MVLEDSTSPRGSSRHKSSVYEVVPGDDNDLYDDNYNDNDGRRKVPSIIPRNYTGRRRQCIIAGSLFLLFVVVLVHGTYTNQHKDHG